MSRRDRIRARLIYRAWSIERQLRWFPPYGWITKMQALGLSYRSGTQDLADAMAYMLQVNRLLAIEVDKLVYVDYSEIEKRILADMTAPLDFEPCKIGKNPVLGKEYGMPTRTGRWSGKSIIPISFPKTGRYRKD
jgi:hypothetical protein